MDEKIRVCFILLWILGQLSWTQANKKICNQKLWCSDCITAHQDCAWCKNKDFIGARCSTKDDLIDNECNDEDIIFPNNTASFPQNKNLRDGSEHHDPIQLSPQHVKLTLRPGKTYSFDMKYRVAANLPIDMYFVMDFTITMKDRITELAGLTADLIDGLREMFTKNIHIGFGSFVDKPVQPFSITTAQHLANPCVLQKTQCEPTYGYIHRRRLNNDVNRFINYTSVYRIVKSFIRNRYGYNGVYFRATDKDFLDFLRKDLHTTNRHLVTFSSIQYKVAVSAFMHQITSVKLVPFSLLQYKNFSTMEWFTELQYNGLINEWNTIRNANTSANFDPMEGGLDAVLQAAVCPDIVGWRNQSRRVLVYISDSGFHFAGDGKLAGIDKPNDGSCHMAPYKNSREESIYTHSAILDYPSYGQLKKVLADNNINSFFVVEKTDKVLYKGLTDMIGGQSATETMDAEGANAIVSSITTFFKDLSEKVVITAEDLPEELDVIAETNCSHQRIKSTYNMRELPIKCSDLEIGKEVHINVSIVANECPKDGSRTKLFKFVPSGLQESLLLEVEFICDCECKKSEELDNEKCTQGNGTYECGVCKCKPGRSGEFCQCDNDDSSSDLSIQEANCRKNNDSESLCEDRGVCKCGQCICPKDYEGKHCECDNTKCIDPVSTSTEKCTNKEQGTCECGTCVCKNNYFGEFCQCPSNANCVSQKNGKVCSGNGVCSCGKCDCKTGYNGTVCEDCPRCDNCRKCGNDEQKRCVTCLDVHRKSDNASHMDCQEQCSSLEVTMVARFQKAVQPCGTFDKDKCQINYIILCENDTIHLHLAKTKQCVSPPDPLLIALPVLGGIIGVGLLLLIIWKILTSFYDKIEYARFEHEIQNPKWSQTDNPIYKTPLTSNQNPVYKGTVDD